MLTVVYVSLSNQSKVNECSSKRFVMLNVFHWRLAEKNNLWMIFDHLLAIMMMSMMDSIENVVLRSILTLKTNWIIGFGE